MIRAMSLYSLATGEIFASLPPSIHAAFLLPSLNVCSCCMLAPVLPDERGGEGGLDHGYSLESQAVHWEQKRRIFVDVSQQTLIE